MIKVLEGFPTVVLAFACTGESPRMITIPF